MGKFFKTMDSVLAAYIDREAPVRDGVWIIAVWALCITAILLTIANSPLPTAFS